MRAHCRHRFVEVEGEKGAAGTVDLDQVVRRIDNLVFDSVHKRRISPMYRSCMRDYYYVFKRNKSVCQAVRSVRHGAASAAGRASTYVSSVL